ncbi:MAG: division/cell wall cluster transcriptional repressor MraZ [Oscillospiraceae bacterium]
MLYGEYQHNIDKKGRIFIPAKLREELGDNFMLCRGIEGKRCLCIYSDDEWQNMDEKIRQLPTLKASKVRRFLYVGATKLECDAQGRVLLPQNLREYAGLDGESSILGMSTHLEIWNSEAWSTENEQYTPESIAEIMEGLDF